MHEILQQQQTNLCQNDFEEIPLKFPTDPEKSQANSNTRHELISQTHSVSLGTYSMNSRTEEENTIEAVRRGKWISSLA